MNKFIEFIIEKWEIFPLWLKWVLGILTTLITFGLVIKYTYPIIKDIRNSKKKSESLDKGMLLNHDFFLDLDKMLNYDIKNMNFGSEGKNYIAKLLLKTKINTFIKKTQKFIKNTNFKISVNDCKKLILNNIYECISEYEIKFMSHAYTNEEKEIFNIILKKFNENHLKNEDLIITSINDRFDSDVYQNTHARLCYSLDMMAIPFDFLIQEVESVFIEMNGDLEGKKIHNRLI